MRWNSLAGNVLAAGIGFTPLLPAAFKRSIGLDERYVRPLSTSLSLGLTLGALFALYTIYYGLKEQLVSESAGAVLYQVVMRSDVGERITWITNFFETEPQALAFVANSDEPWGISLVPSYEPVLYDLRRTFTVSPVFSVLGPIAHLIRLY